MSYDAWLEAPYREQDRQVEAWEYWAETFASDEYNLLVMEAEVTVESVDSNGVGTPTPFDEWLYGRQADRLFERWYVALSD